MGEHEPRRRWWRLRRGTPKAGGTVSVDYEKDGTRVVSRNFTDASGKQRMTRHSFPDAVQHHYRPTDTDDDSDVLLYAGELSFPGEEHRPYVGDVTFTWRRTPRIRVRGTRAVDGTGIEEYFSPPPGGSMWVDVQGVVIALQDGKIPDQPNELAPAETFAGSSLHVDERVDQQVGDATELEEVTFLVPNGWQAHDETRIFDPEDVGHTWHGRTQAQGDGWTVVFDRNRTADSKAWETLKRSGGHRFTHVGRLTRTDGASFSGEGALEALERVRLGLCLALGRRTTCVLPVGRRGGQPVWALWRGNPVDSYSNASHWLDSSTCSKQLAEIVSRVLEFSNDATRLETLTHALSYYVAANVDVDVHLQVSLPVSGLQLLTYYQFVTDGPHTAKEWEALVPKERGTEWELRQLLSKMNVSVPMPPHFQNLAAVQRRLATSGAQRDALGVVIKMRNVATHPTKDQPGNYSIYQWAEAGMLARYWLGLALLHTIGYRGDIAAILQARPRETGELRSVPWASAWSAGLSPSGP
ncbi:hypothetical protein OG729_20050 [Streptomyces sp. NBC_00210]|uniref:hypothetical protein n=1 Tax=Streptomyces sp. NBC_00210 TaxID=2903636 RepID=UPI00324809D5